MKYSLLLKKLGDKRSFKDILTEAQEKNLKTVRDSDITCVDIDMDELPDHHTEYILGYLLLTTKDQYLVPCGILLEDKAANVIAPLPFDMWDMVWKPEDEAKIDDASAAISYLIHWSLRLEHLMRGWNAVLHPDKRATHEAALKANRAAINKLISTNMLELVVEGKHKVTQLLDGGVRLEDKSVWHWKDISVPDLAYMYITAAKFVPEMADVQEKPEEKTNDNKEAK